MIDRPNLADVFWMQNNNNKHVYNLHQIIFALKASVYSIYAKMLVDVDGRLDHYKYIFLFLP